MMVVFVVEIGVMMIMVLMDEDEDDIRHKVSYCALFHE